MKRIAVRTLTLAACVAFAACGETDLVMDELSEVEAQDLTQVDEALAVGAEIILADNLTVDDIRETVRRAKGRAKVEISGGVTLERIVELRETGADYVSIGALTHSAPAVDISFEIEPI